MRLIPTKDYNPQGGIPLTKDTSSWQPDADQTLAGASQ